MSVSVPSLLTEIPNPSEAYNDSPALIIPASDSIISYSRLRSIILPLSQQLRSVLPSPLSVVAIAIPNSLPFVLSFLATTWANAVAAPLNSAYTLEEMKFYLSDSEVNLLVVDSNGNKSAEDAAQELGIPVVIVSPEGTLIPKTPEDLVIKFVETTAPAADDFAMFLHTSGTTSRPKRVPLTHRNMCTTVGNIIQTYELNQEDRGLLVMPLFHVHGLMAGLLSPLYSGGSVVLHGEKFSATKFWTHVSDYQCNWYTAVPTIHQILLARIAETYPKLNPPKLRFIRSCSASLAPSVLEDLEKSFGAPVLEAYAMTEAAHQMTSNPLPKYGPRKPGSVGKPTNVELAILSDSGVIVDVGKVGEVCIRGANVTSGYLNNAEANKTAFEYGWFHTGDQGFLDSDGYLTLTGRIKELINRGGEKISPLEVDAILLSHPNVSEAVCFAVPDKMYGQLVGAAVVPKSSESTLTKEEIQIYCKGKLADFKIPVEVFILDSMPRTATGKIQRRIVAELLLFKNQQHTEEEAKH